MKGLVFAVLAASASMVTAHKAVWHANSTHLFVPWSNGTHFTDPGSNQTIRHFDCDVHHGRASAHFNRTVSRLHLKHKNSNIGTRAARVVASKQKKQQVTTPITVPVYMHVITTQAAAGTITQAMATAQVAALNTAYNPHGVTFVLQKTDFTVNDAWAVGDGADMDALKHALRAGSYAALNLYMHSDLAGGVLGTCTLPNQVQPNTPPALYYSDGCNVNAHTMPGGTLAGYNMGMTAVHETGHWLGLLHTFEGYACSGDGDLIADTPMESQSTNGCPASPVKNSCPGVSTGDPIHNYMDYSTDACYTRFTPGQIQRISALWTQYRAGM